MGWGYIKGKQSKLLPIWGWTVLHALANDCLGESHALLAANLSPFGYYRCLGYSSALAGKGRAQVLAFKIELKRCISLGQQRDRGSYWYGIVGFCLHTHLYPTPYARGSHRLIYETIPGPVNR